MTDNEIIKALECCFTNDWNRTKCDKCKFYTGTLDCVEDLKCASIDLITRQQAELERLKIENQSLRGAANSYKVHYESLKSEKDELIKTYQECQVSNLKAFVKSLCKDRISNDPVVIAAQVELKEWIGETE